MGVRLTPVRGVLAEDIPAIWQDIKPLVLQALEHDNGDHSVAEVFESLVAGRRMLNVTDDPRCILISEIAVYPSGARRLNIFAVAGKLPKDWLEIVESLGQWAKAEKGCASIEMRGRNGWARKLRRGLWKPSYIAMRKEL